MSITLKQVETNIKSTLSRMQMINKKTDHKGNDKQ